MEACFYECDHNMGKYRKYSTCLDGQGDQNGWQINGLPLQQTMVNSWWNACKEDVFCTGPSGDYFELPTLADGTCVPAPAGSPLGTETATCKKFKNIYGNATDMINRLWGGSFSVASGAGGFVFPEPKATPYDNGATPNPNNVASQLADPPFCGFRPTVSGWIQAMNDFKLYVANMLTYTGTPFGGALYNSFNTLPSASWWTIPPAEPEAPACTSSAAPALRAAAAAGVAALAALTLA
jgi:folate receptor